MATYKFAIDLLECKKETESFIYSYEGWTGHDKDRSNTYLYNKKKYFIMVDRYYSVGTQEGEEVSSTMYDTQ